MDDQLKQKKIDPSENKQIFSEIKIKLHCCRYWICTQWECTNMAFPFWRIYHNKTKGARIIFNAENMELTDDKIIIIPPNTSYSNYLVTKDSKIKTESIVGSMVKDINDINYCVENESFDHLFVHFNIGTPYDFVKPGVYAIVNNDFYSDLLKKIEMNCINGGDTFDFKSSMDIHLLILSILAKLPKELWMKLDMDNRILLCQQYVQNNLQADLSNSKLASLAYMATNSFSRLFKENTGESVQQYVMKSKIENARLLMHHSDKSIDSIASECGFCNRHYFSKAFKQIVGMSPGYYKQNVT
jgi:AraC-like DNA-binding protein